MNRQSKVVLLNGPGSSGKTSIARAMQAITSRPFLHVQLDDFIAMMPPSLFGHPDGLEFTPVNTDGRPAVRVHSGPTATAVFQGMRRAIAALADAGNDMIVDDVIWGGEMADYRALLMAHEFRTVGVVAPLDVLEARERARGDRFIGLARWQFDRVHAGNAYDLEVDTGAATQEACARRIVDAFAL